MFLLLLVSVRSAIYQNLEFQSLGLDNINDVKLRYYYQSMSSQDISKSQHLTEI